MIYLKPLGRGLSGRYPDDLPRGLCHAHTKEDTMTGPDHYRAAEQELMLAESNDLHGKAYETERGEALKRAHVHAMLAVAAATIDVGTQVIVTDESLSGQKAYTTPQNQGAWTQVTC